MNKKNIYALIFFFWKIEKNHKSKKMKILLLNFYKYFYIFFPLSKAILIRLVFRLLSLKRRSHFFFLFLRYNGGEQNS